MYIDLQKYKLPPIYKRNNRDCFLDPIRQKLIYITPEETVRQRVVSFLINELKVPANMISVEENLSHYYKDIKKRADIVIMGYNVKENASSPIAVIECKAPGVLLGEKASVQMIEYADTLLCDYAVLTDGNIMFCYKYDSLKDEYVQITELPKYSDMLFGKHENLPLEELPERLGFDELESYLDDYSDDIGVHTPAFKAVPALNLWEGLLDTRHKMPCGKYGMFELLKDYGVRLLSYGNAAGGMFCGPYRSFLISVNGSTEFISLSVSTYTKTTKPDVIKTSLNVAIDNEKTSHHALQLIIDDNLSVVDNVCKFYHHGRIAVGNIGSGKVSELRSFVSDRYPEIIYGEKFLLGTLVHDRLWRLDDPEVVKVVENLISYALIRDEYRTYVKENRK